MLPQLLTMRNEESDTGTCGRTIADGVAGGRGDMADIKQAAKWMAEGERVKRSTSNWSGWYLIANEPHISARPNIVKMWSPKEKELSFACLDLWSMLADDWEIAE
jgi:hypothetical protein